MTQSPIRLTEYSHGAGCGCKISPKALRSILREGTHPVECPRLIVGNETRDDAAVYDLGDGTAIISTTDFFLPIVNDPFTFGKISATNAISDIYAMGGSPLLAIAILGWPINKIPAEVAGEVMEGGRAACRDAGIPLAGGHSIDNPEPLFGLAVTGQVNLDHLKRNDTARPGSVLFLTKPLGIGILSTAQKEGILKAGHEQIGPDSMMKLNRIGVDLGKLPAVTAMTDVTGFGLLGHLLEMCEGSGVSAEIDLPSVPVFPEAREYLERDAIPGGTLRNWDSYGDRIGDLDETPRLLLCDPQTSGGLLIAVEETAAGAVRDLLTNAGLHADPIGRIVARREKPVLIRGALPS